MSIKKEIQKLDPSGIIDLFVLDTTALGGGVVRYHSGVNEKGSPVVWKGDAYDPFPIKAIGFDKSSKGKLPRPIIEISNIGGILSLEIQKYNDLVGATVTRKRTLIKYLDAINFINGNPDADSNEQFPDEIYIINRKVLETNEAIKFELASPFDAPGAKLPGRSVIQNTCTWVYRSANCSYAGGPVAKFNDVLTSNPAEDNCGKRLESCKIRFGEYAVLPYGAFPGAGLIR